MVRGTKVKALIFSLIAMSLAGCASAPATDNIATLFADAQFTAPAEPVSGSDVFALSDSMRDYLAGSVARRARMDGLQLGLLHALQGELRIEYDAAMTRNAAQAFEARAGNCLSLVIMTAAFAKQLGIPVTYQNVYGYDTWSRSGGIAFHSGHVNLVLGSRRPAGALSGDSDRHLIVDFLPPDKAAAGRAQAIPEEMVVAMYLNNRAAETLADGDLDRAYWWARAAIKTLPTFVPAYNTLGVIYARHGNAPLAERALRYALTREPESVEALTNLAQLLEAEGRVAEARALRKKLAAIEPYPPFYFLDRGMTAMAKGDYESAVKLFEKELARRPYDDEVHFALAVAELRLGDVQRARRQLKLALENSTTRDRHEIYAAKLEHLRSLLN